MLYNINLILPDVLYFRNIFTLYSLHTMKVWYGDQKTGTTGSYAVDGNSMWDGPVITPLWSHGDLVTGWLVETIESEKP